MLWKLIGVSILAACIGFLIPVIFYGATFTAFGGFFILGGLVIGGIFVIA